MKKIILASASPRRSSLLSQVGLEFEVVPSSYEEVIENETPQEAVMKLALGKAADVCKNYNGAVIIGADTIVACDDEILGKPHDEADAFRMLNMLSGKSHYVYTGVAIIENNNGIMKKKVFYEETRVDFVKMSDEDIRGYIAAGEYIGKAGAYAIQGRCAAFISGICGDYNNVVGLPVGRVYRELRNF